jgi:hypothetical protein
VPNIEDVTQGTTNTEPIYIGKTSENELIVVYWSFKKEQYLGNIRQTSKEGDELTGPIFRTCGFMLTL